MGGHGHGHGHGHRPCAPAAPSPRRTSVLCCVLLPVCALEGLAETTTDCVHGGDGMPTRRHALGETRSGVTEHSPARTLLLLLRTRMRRWMARARTVGRSGQIQDVRATYRVPRLSHQIWTGRLAVSREGRDRPAKRDEWPVAQQRRETPVPRVRDSAARQVPAIMPGERRYSRSVGTRRVRSRSSVETGGAASR